MPKTETPMPTKAAKGRYTGGFSELSSDQAATMRRHLNALEISVEFCRPYFEKFVRMDRLYHGQLPDELDCTFSKVMLYLAYSTVQNELPRSAAALFSGEDFFVLSAEDKELESAAKAATAWLKYTIRNRNRIFPRILPTLTSVGVYGTGYRGVTHSPVTYYRQKRVPRRSFAGIPYGWESESEKVVRPQIVCQNLEIWSVLPGPTGGSVNATDPLSGEAVPWLHWIDYISKEKLQAMAKKRGANARQIQLMLEKPPQAHEDPNQIDVEFRESVRTDGHSDWMSQLRTGTKEGLDAPYRCVWTFFRDRWLLVGENKFLLADVPPLLDWIPVAKYQDTPDMLNWFGTGLLETCEDVLLAYLLTFNFRLDYLAQTLHPHKFIRSDIVHANRAKGTDFDPTPYALYQFPRSVQDIQRAVWYDRFPELSPQAFMEETNFKQLMQEITAQPNYMKGMGGAGTLANETATGIVSLIEEGTARSTLRALVMEYTGLHDELMLALKWAKKYIWEDQEIRVKSEDGWPWMTVPVDAIDDGFGIELMGTRALVHKNEMVKRMLSILPMLINNPNVPNQRELMKQALGRADIFPDTQALMSGSPESQGVALPAGSAPGMGGTPTVQNEAQAVRGAVPAQFAV